MFASTRLWTVVFASLSFNFILFVPNDYGEHTIQATTVTHCMNLLINRKIPSFPHACTALLAPGEELLETLRLIPTKSHFANYRTLANLASSMDESIFMLENSATHPEPIDLFSFFVMANRVQVVKYILESDLYPWITSISYYVKTPITFACIHGRTEMVKLFIKMVREEDRWVFHKYSSTLKTPIIYAIEYGHYDIVKLLFQSGIYNISMWRDLQGYPIMKSDIVKRQNGWIALLMKDGVLTSQSAKLSEDFETPFCTIWQDPLSHSMKGEDVPNFLMSFGLKHPDTVLHDWRIHLSGLSPFEMAFLMAIYQDNLETFERLSAKVSEDFFGNSYFQRRFLKFLPTSSYARVEPMLTQTQSDNFNILTIAMFFERTGIVKFILDRHERTVFFLSQEHRTVIFFAVGIKRMDYFYWILNESRDDPWYLHQPDKNSQTPLQLALNRNQNEMALALISSLVHSCYRKDFRNIYGGWSLISMILYSGNRHVYEAVLISQETDQLFQLSTGSQSLLLPAGNSLLHLCLVNIFEESMCQDVIDKQPYLLYHKNNLLRLPIQVSDTLMNDLSGRNVTQWIEGNMLKYPKEKYGSRESTSNINETAEKTRADTAMLELLDLLEREKEEEKAKVKIEKENQKRRKSQKIQKKASAARKQVKEEKEQQLKVALQKQAKESEKRRQRSLALEREKRAKRKQKERESLLQQRQEAATSRPENFSIHEDEDEISQQFTQLELEMEMEIPDDNSATSILSSEYRDTVQVETTNRTIGTITCFGNSSWKKFNGDGRDEERAFAIKYYGFPEDYDCDPLEHPLLVECQIPISSIQKRQISSIDEGETSSDDESIDVILRLNPNPLEFLCIGRQGQFLETPLNFNRPLTEIFFIVPGEMFVQRVYQVFHLKYRHLAQDLFSLILMVNSKDSVCFLSGLVINLWRLQLWFRGDCVHQFYRLSCISSQTLKHDSLPIAMSLFSLTNFVQYELVPFEIFNQIFFELQSRGDLEILLRHPLLLEAFDDFKTAFWYMIKYCPEIWGFLHKHLPFVPE